MTHLLAGPDGLLVETEDEVESSRSYPAATLTFGGSTVAFVTVQVRRRGLLRARPPRVTLVGHDLVLNHELGSGIIRRLLRWEDRRTFVFLVDPPRRSPS